MTFVYATLLLLAAAPFVLWPLIRHWQPEPERPPRVDLREARLRELEELELDVSAGRLSAREAELRRAELER